MFIGCVVMVMVQTMSTLYGDQKKKKSEIVLFC